MEDKRVTIGKSLGAMIFFGASFVCLSWFVRVLTMNMEARMLLFTAAPLAIATGTLFGAGVYCIRFGVLRAALGTIFLLAGFFALLFLTGLALRVL